MEKVLPYSAEVKTTHMAVRSSPVPRECLMASSCPHVSTADLLVTSELLYCGMDFAWRATLPGLSGAAVAPSFRCVTAKRFTFPQLIADLRFCVCRFPRQS